MKSPEIQNEIAKVWIRKHLMGNVNLSIEVIFTESYCKPLIIVITLMYITKLEKKKSYSVVRKVWSKS